MRGACDPSFNAGQDLRQTPRLRCHLGFMPLGWLAAVASVLCVLFVGFGLAGFGWKTHVLTSFPVVLALTLPALLLRWLIGLVTRRTVSLALALPVGVLVGGCYIPIVVGAFVPSVGDEAMEGLTVLLSPLSGGIAGGVWARVERSLCLFRDAC